MIRRLVGRVLCRMGWHDWTVMITGGDSAEADILFVCARCRKSQVDPPRSGGFREL